MIRASATASGIAPAASSSTSSTALRHIPRPRRRPGTHVVISKPPMRGFASSNTASSQTPALSRPVLPPLLSRDGTTSRAKSSSSVVLTHPQVKVVSSPLIFESQFSTSASLKKNKKPAVPKRQTIEGDVIYRKEGSKIVRVEDPTEGLDAPVSSLFQAMGALEAPAAAYGQNQDDAMKARKGSDATTADLRTLTLNDMLPSDSILEALMQQQKFKTTLSELKMLLQPMVDVLPLPEEDPKRVKVEKELWNAMKKKDVQGVYCLAGWALKYAADGGPLALALYRTASQNGDYISRYCYATLLYRGAKGMPPDRPKGRKMLESLARPPSKSLFKPFPLALSTLAGIYALDDHNFEGARDLYLQAAKAGVTEAYLPLSRMYLQGELPRDEALARKYLEMAVKAEDTLDSEKSQAMAHFLLANMDMMKQDSDETKFKSAFQHYQKAASKGLPEAQYNLGNVYFKGLGVGRNEALAVEYWKMSAMQGFGLAQLSLGAYYFQNEEEGSPKKHEWDSSKRDLMQAQKWFTLASRRPGELGSEGERLKAQVNEAIKRGGGGVRNGPCVIM